ncbi:MAG: NAD+ synthase [Candidatus Omnitrophota bacterium]|nr:NAD+ synthase [Candidatus Omnitrophota bacterium]
MKKIRFAIAQMNPTVGDYAGNVRKILAWVRRAQQRKADIIVFPELALSGYPVWDLANKAGFVSEGLKHLDRIALATKGKKTAVVLGFVEPAAKQPPGANHHPARSYNALAWLEGGKIKAKQHKRLLPTYDVFLEELFFESGKASKVIPWRLGRVGPTICEDLWDQGYAHKPVSDLVSQRAQLIINISASPYYRGVAGVRDSLLKRHAVRSRCPLLYVNQVGGQDDLIFDGRSVFVDSKGRVLFRAKPFKEELCFFDWESPRPEEQGIVLPPINEPAEMYEALCLGISDYCSKNGFRKVVIGLSGGIDSAVVAALAVDALGKDAVLGVTMPSGFSSRGSWKDSEELAKRLGIEFRNYPIRGKYDYLVKAYDAQRSGRKAKGKKKITLAMENLQARIRGLELMYLSNDEGRLLLSTGNKSELAMGYCTLYGDMAGGLCVLGDVYKSDVYRLAWYRNRDKEVIPDVIIRKPPSAELRPDQKDEDSLPPYDLLDEVLYQYIEENRSRDEIQEMVRPRGISAATVKDAIRRVDHNEYKRRQTPPILRVTQKAWFGRRMPITNRFDR